MGRTTNIFCALLIQNPELYFTYLLYTYIFIYYIFGCAVNARFPTQTALFLHPGDPG